MHFWENTKNSQDTTNNLIWIAKEKFCSDVQNAMRVLQ